MEWLADILSQGDYDTSRVIRRRISRLSRISKLWSKVLRPFLFRHLRLRSTSDIHFLSSILHSTTSQWLRPHITALYLHCVSATWPDELRLSPPLWRVLFPLLPSLTRLRVNNELVSGGILVPPRHRPIFQSVKGLQYLELDGLRFSSFSSFLRLLKGMHALKVAELWDVRWPLTDSSRAVPDDPTFSDFQELRILTTSHWDSCIDLAWPFVNKSFQPLSLASHCSSASASPDAHAIIHLVHALYADITSVHSLIFSETRNDNGEHSHP